MEPQRRLRAGRSWSRKIQCNMKRQCVHLWWEVGAQCQAVWSEDGLVYPATVVSMDGERCRVRFSGYGSEEDVDLSALRGPKHRYWKPGSRSRAVFSEDGLVYPAEVLWVKGQRCRVRFDNCNNEENHDLNRLLNPDELCGPSRPNTTDPMSFIPPPPFWMFEGKESSSSASVETLSSMLMLWYMCGFHTGTYVVSNTLSTLNLNQCS
ncbi:Survival motor neuron protein [Channa argus]|uniref:Survival motor neuron protein n=1 Tax=Channa argus TaxID=215402 RepID=A0A6G1PK08_CHAAH|nr:Survival motor neuron protein [Channa argus]